MARSAASSERSLARREAASASCTGSTIIVCGICSGSRTSSGTSNPPISSAMLANPPLKAMTIAPFFVGEFSGGVGGSFNRVGFRIGDDPGPLVDDPHRARDHGKLDVIGGLRHKWPHRDCRALGIGQDDSPLGPGDRGESGGGGSVHAVKI